MKRATQVALGYLQCQCTPNHCLSPGRNNYGPNCMPLWRREHFTEVDVSNDTGGVSGLSSATAATPAQYRCNANLGGDNTGGNAGFGLLAPANWYGGDCKMIGQYMWLRKVGYTLYASCDGYTSGPTVIENTAHYFNFHGM